MKLGRSERFTSPILNMVYLKRHHCLYPHLLHFTCKYFNREGDFNHSIHQSTEAATDRSCFDDYSANAKNSTNIIECLYICTNYVLLIFMIYFAVNILHRNEMFLHFSNISRALIYLL